MGPETRGTLERGVRGIAECGEIHQHLMAQPLDNGVRFHVPRHTVCHVYLSRHACYVVPFCALMILSSARHIKPQIILPAVIDCAYIDLRLGPEAVYAIAVLGIHGFNIAEH